MNAVAGFVSVCIGIWVVIQTRKWFFESDEDFWKSSGSAGTFFQEARRSSKYLRYLDNKGNQLTFITWLMTGLLSTLLSYALLNLLFP